MGPLDARAFEILAAHAKLAEIVALTRAVVGAAADTRRAAWIDAATVKEKLEELKLERADGVTPHGNAIDVLERGPESSDESALAGALWAHVVADAAPKTHEDEDKAAAQLLWLAANTPFDATGLVDKALGDGADGLWAAIADQVRRIDDPARAKGGPFGRGEALCGCTALAMSVSPAAVKQSNALAIELKDAALVKIVAPSPLAPARLSTPPPPGSAPPPPLEQGADATKAAALDPAPTASLRPGSGAPPPMTPSRPPSRHPADITARLSSRPPPQERSMERTEERMTGEMLPTPRGPLATAALALTGLLFLFHLTRLVAKLALAYKRPAEVTLSKDSVRIHARTELLGRTLRERDIVIARSGLAKATREVRYPRVAFYAGLLALALGRYVGMATLVDGVRSASPSLLLTGVLIVAIGIGLDFILGSLAPGVSGRVRVAFVPRSGSAVCVGGVDAKRADAALQLLAAPRV
jgi:hypothetical protein